MKAIRENGFSLIEILFTLVIISVAAMAIARNSMSNINTVNRDLLRYHANNLAQSKLVEIIGEKSYRKGNSGLETIDNVDFHWQSGYTQSPVSNNDNTIKYDMDNISVTVNWQQGGQKQSITVRQYIWPRTEQKVQP